MVTFIKPLVILYWALLIVFPNPGNAIEFDDAVISPILFLVFGCNNVGSYTPAWIINSLSLISTRSPNFFSLYPPKVVVGAPSFVSVSDPLGAV